jgi:hypothetical protein
VVVLRFELRAYALSHHHLSPFLMMEFFKIGCLELGAEASFEPQSS